MPIEVGVTDPDSEPDNVTRFPGHAERERLRRHPESAPGPARPPRVPMFNIPPVVSALLLIIIIGYLVQVIVPASTGQWMLTNLGFIPARYTLADQPGWQTFIGPFSYMMLHGGPMHLGMNALMLLAFGAGMERMIGGARLVGFLITTGVIAAFCHMAIYPQSIDPVIGASGGISGLFGGLLLLLKRQGAMRGIGRFAILWVVVLMVTGLLGTGAGGQTVAWAAHVGGFLAGVVMLHYFLPPPRRGAGSRPGSGSAG